MLKSMIIQGKGNPTPTHTMTFEMTDGQLNVIEFDSVIITRKDDIVQLRYTLKQPVDFKPWRIASLLNDPKGLHTYTDIKFITDRFFVVFADNMIQEAQNRLAATNNT